MENRKAFTLIELLVVIAIIALLMAVILPALSAVKENAKKTVCMAHMKGLGDAVLIYTQQENGELPQPLDGSFISSNYSSGLKDLGLDSGTDYYTYHSTPTGSAYPRAVSGVGFLYKAGLIESGTDLPFCPSMKQLFGHPMPTQNWNPKGQVSHWNYIGQSVVGATHILEDPDMHIGWMPTRLTIGIRKLYHFGGKRGYQKVENAAMKGKRAFLCDLWVATGMFGTYWQSRETDIPHKTGKRTSLNTWYIDGHGKSVKIESERYSTFTDPETGVEDSFLNSGTTWANMLD